MKKVIILAIILLTLFSSTAFAAKLPTEKYVWNDQDTRTGAFISLDDPTFAYSPAYLFNGCKVLVVDEDAALGVSKIDVMGNTRWVQTKYLVDELQSSQTPYWLERVTLIDTDIYSVRSELADLSPEYIVIGSIPKGETVQILADLGFLLVRYNGKEMYILDRRFEDDEQTVWFASLDLEEESHPSLLTKAECFQLACNHLKKEFGLTTIAIDEMQVYSHYHNYIRRHNEYCFRFSDDLSSEETFYQVIVQPETGFIARADYFEKNVDNE